MIPPFKIAYLLIAFSSGVLTLGPGTPYVRTFIDVRERVGVFPVLRSKGDGGLVCVCGNKPTYARERERSCYV